MDWTAYLTNALVAAAIGAGTNELAIVAILRYILPRKKGEIARRIRRLIASDLLSPDKMRAKLDEPEVRALLARHLDASLGQWLSRTLPAPDALLADDDADRAAARIRDILLDALRRRADSPEFVHGVLAPFLRDRYRALKERSPESFLRGPGAAALAAGAAGDWLRRLEESPELRERLRRALDQWLAERIAGAGSLGDLLPSGMTRAARELAAEQAPALAEELARLLAEPAVADAVTGAVMAAITGQLRGQGVVGNIKGLVVNAMGLERDVRGVCARLPDTLRRSLSRPGRLEELSRALSRAVAARLDRPLDPEYRTLETRMRIGNALMAMVWKSSVFASLAGAFAAAVERGLTRSVERSLAAAGLDDAPEAAFAAAAERLGRMLVSDGTREFLADRFDAAYREWKTRPLGRLDRFVDGDARERLASALAEEVAGVLRLRLADFAEESGVWDIVVSSIEGYDDRQLSRMIQQLARSELRWVTVLGGVIGFGVGLLHSLVLALYSG